MGIHSPDKRRPAFSGSWSSISGLAEATEILGTNGKSGKPSRLLEQLKAALRRELRGTHSAIETPQSENARQVQECRDRSSKIEKLLHQIIDVILRCQDEVVRLEAETAQQANGLAA